MSQESFRKDTNAIKKYLPGHEAQVYGITVGSETLYRGNFTGEELLTKINQVKAMFPDVLPSVPPTAGTSTLTVPPTLSSRVVSTCCSVI